MIEDCRFGDKTMPNMPQEPTVDIMVAGTATTHAKYIQGWADSLSGDKTMVQCSLKRQRHSDISCESQANEMQV